MTTTEIVIRQHDDFNKLMAEMLADTDIPVEHHAIIRQMLRTARATGINNCQEVFENIP